MQDDWGEVLKIAEAVRAAGGRALLVGGCVRDSLLGRPCHDFDVEVYGLGPERLRSTLSAGWQFDSVGASFGVLKVKHHEIDIALPRTENRLGAGHRDFAVATDPELSVAEAAARRDFTVNAILQDPLTGEIIDPWNGRADLEHKVLRHVSEHFVEDPLRVLRAMQFAARFRYDVAPETVALCATMTQDALPRERLAAEWEKLLLKGEEPSRGLEFLRACGWLRFYPEIEALVGVPQSALHHPEGDVWRHTCLVLDASVRFRTGNADRDLELALAALCHDFGKPATTVDRGEGKFTSYNHETEGAPMARDFTLRLWNQPKRAEAVARLVASHMRPVQLVLGGAADKAYRRLAIEAGRLDELADLVECDMRGTFAPASSLDIVRRFREKIASLAIEKAPPEPLVMGRDLIARGLRPGPDFGPILDRCYEAQLSGEFTDREGAIAFLETVLSA